MGYPPSLSKWAVDTVLKQGYPIPCFVHEYPHFHLKEDDEERNQVDGVHPVESSEFYLELY